MSSQNVWQLIQEFNRGRNADILSRKYETLQKDAFTFFRGTSHLFVQGLLTSITRISAPCVWICGDLHLENFGTYKGDDRQIYFGINDFDEGVLAPCTWDLVRLVTSIYLVGEHLDVSLANTETLARAYLSTYADTLISARVVQIDADNAQGIVKELFVDLRERKRIDLLKKRTRSIDGFRRLIFDDDKILRLDNQRQQQVKQVIDIWAQTQANPDFWRVLDIGFRVAGVGSLGVDRYLVLVEGKGSPDRNYLLDLKQQPHSALQSSLTNVQPQWQNQAQRVMKIQQLVQPAPPALLAAIEFNNSSYLLRELQPTQDKITLKPGKFKLSQLDKLIDTMAKITASAHLHGSGKLGAATAAELTAFGHNLDWQEEILKYASQYAKQVQLDYQDFCLNSPR